MDTATRHDRAILGINVQIITSNKLEIFTLAMLKLKQKHTAQYLTTKIENVLKSFNIDKAQVYAVTTDNGRNMVKAVELLSLHSDDEESDSEIEDNYESIVCNVRFENIISIKCAAHTLQLAVKDYLDNLNTNVVNKSRNCVKYLRTPAYRHSIKSSQTLKPILDVPTRWSSTYNMLKRLLHLKEFCCENLPLSEQLQRHEWAELENIMKALQPVNTLTLKLQKSNLRVLFGDFYKNWLELIFTLKDFNTEMTRQLLDHIEKRQTKLLEWDTMYAALFLDPRFKRVLSNEKINSAKNHLKKNGAPASKRGGTFRIDYDSKIEHLKKTS
uniref:Zinc finger BED domain-containing protein 4 n=1 Tax=Bactrocera dorsalis TaxID=27457 RepID=A0A034WXN7_BACDO